MFSTTAFTDFTAKDGNRGLTFRALNIMPIQLNAVRRAANEEVETLAFQSHEHETATIRFQENTTRFNNQILGLRLSLIPVHVPATLDVDRQEFHIDAESGEDERDVTSLDIKIFDRRSGEQETDEAKVRLVFPPDPITGDGILITPLRGTNEGVGGERLSVRATLVKGVGTTHACFNPVVQWATEFVVDEERATALRAELERREMERIGGEMSAEDRLRFDNRFEHLDKKKAQRQNEQGEASDIIVKVETSGVMSAAELVRDSIRGVVKILTRARIAFDNPGTKRVTVTDSARWLGAKDVKIIGEGHTLGTLVQAQTVDHYIRRADGPLDQCGYVRTHPLKDELVFCLRFVEGAGGDDKEKATLALLSRVCTELAAAYEGLLEKWERAAAEFLG